MYKVLGSTLLKSGERMEVGVIQAPDAEWRERLSAFLIHKGSDWVPQVEAALAGPLDPSATGGFHNAAFNESF